MPKPPLLYPKRQRCRVCRRYWGFALPIRGLYCSPECAGRPPLVMSDVNGVQVPPRSCRNYIQNLRPTTIPEIRWKRVFVFEADALEYARQHNMTMDAYDCPNCWYWHLASPRSARPLAPLASP